MKKDDRNNLRRERFIMLSTSAMVLTALTVSGVYMRNHSQRAQDNGYTIDFSALENRADDKIKEISDHSGREKADQIAKEQEELILPQLEAGSDEVKIPGLTDRNSTEGSTSKKDTVDQSGSKGMSAGAGESAKEQKSEQTETKPTQKETKPQKEVTTGQKAASEQETPVQVAENTAPQEEEVLDVVATAGESQVVIDNLHFESATMIKPVSGVPLIDYSMDHSVYFATLDQYKYNPAVIYGAPQGEEVLACNTGRVINIHNDSELGHVLILDLGDGYQAIYGQLENIDVPIGGIVEAGRRLATVAAPTKYYSVEGSNLYFQLKKDGESINPENYFR